jgi:hypothetical protein
LPGDREYSFDLRDYWNAERNGLYNREGIVVGFLDRYITESDGELLAQRKLWERNGRMMSTAGGAPRLEISCQASPISVRNLTFTRD